MDLVCQRVVEEKLRSELIIISAGTLGTDRKVDVYRSTRIPARIDRLELDPATGVRKLVAAQKFLPAGVKALIGNAGILTVRVAVPDVHLRAFDGSTAIVAKAGNHDVQGERDPFLHRIIGRLGTNIRAIKLIIHKIRSNRQFGADHAVKRCACDRRNLR